MGEITLRKALDDYITVYMPYRNFAERTREEYQNDLADFVGFLEKTGINDTKGLGLPIIERYVAQLEEKGLASRTRKRKVAAIRSFLSFSYQDGYIDSNIGKRIILPFTESTTPYVLTQSECDRLRKTCADNPRDQAVIELLLQTGIKLSELIHLTLDDIELEEPKETGERDNGFIRLLGGRGKKKRLIPLNTQACLALRNYMDVRKDTGNSTLFLNRFGESFGERGVQKMLRKYLKSAGIGRASVRTLRHTFGVHHAAKGTSQKTIGNVMGYKDVRSTGKYVSLAHELMRNELQDHAL